MMKRNIIASILLSTLLVAGCYKEDTGVLYSRQYVIAESIKEINERISQINKELAGIGDLVKVIEAREPITNLTYKLGVAGDTLGVTVQMNSKSFYIPYGRNGKDGASPTIDIDPKTGMWVINGIITEHRAVGRDAKVPVVSAKPDPNNPTDENFYWTVKVEGEDEKFILTPGGEKIRANGLKGDKGDPGTPGVNSPIVNIEKGADGKTVIITTTLPGIGSIELPLNEFIEFVIKPEEPAVNATKWDEANRMLKFSSFGEEIEVPYDHSDPLTEVFAEVPTGWGVRLDTLNRKAYIKSPAMDAATVSEHHNVKAKFHAITPEGKSWVRYVNLDMKEKFILSYFYNGPEQIPTGVGSSTANLFQLDENSGNRLKLEFAYRKYADSRFTLLDPIYELTAHSDIVSKVKSFPADVIDKPEGSYEEMEYLGLIYNPDLFHLLSPLPGADPNKPTDKVLIMKQFITDETDKKPEYAFVRPIPWDTYAAVGVVDNVSVSRSQIVKTRLRRLTQEYEIVAANPHSMLGIDPGEEFDITRLRCYTLTHVGMRLTYSGENGHLFYQWANPRGGIYQSVYCRAQKGDPYTTFEYDKARNLLHVKFATFCNTFDYFVKVLVEYTTNDGNKVKKVLRLDPTSEGGPFFGQRYENDSRAVFMYATPPYDQHALSVLNRLFQPMVVILQIYHTATGTAGKLDYDLNSKVLPNAGDSPLNRGEAKGELIWQ